MIGAVEQIVFVRTHFGQAVGKGRVDMHMAGRAGAAAAAQSEQFVKPLSRMTSINDNPFSASISRPSPLREITVTFVMKSSLNS